jgi:uncharacterized protein
MKLLFDDIPLSPKQIRFSELTEDLNDIYAQREMRDFRFPRSVEIELVYYRSGRELFFHGSLGGVVEAHCSRCLTPFAFRLSNDFEFILVPAPVAAGQKAGEISRDEIGLSYYSAEEINLTPLIREQVLLALPTRPLCKENCRGLCSGCGIDLNDEDCRCGAAARDPRMVIFQTIKIGR